MGHVLPVFFFAVDAVVSVPDGSSWVDVQGLIGAAIDSGTLWEATSRNWWHVYVTRRIADSIGLRDLAFLKSECVCITADQLDAVDLALAHIERHLLGAERLPELAGDHEYELVANPAYAADLATVEPLRDIHPSYSHAADEARSYYVFLRSLRAAISEAKGRGGHLLVVQPQP